MAIDSVPGARRVCTDVERFDPDHWDRRKLYAVRHYFICYKCGEDSGEDWLSIEDNEADAIRFCRSYMADVSEGKRQLERDDLWVFSEVYHYKWQAAHWEVEDGIREWIPGEWEDINTTEDRFEFRVTKNGILHRDYPTDWDTICGV